MKRRIFFTAFCLMLSLSLSLWAQDETKLSKKELRAQKKAEQNKKDSIYHISAVDALKSSNFIFKMSSISVTGGAMEYVAANVNFLIIEDDLFTFQTSTGFGGGPNNMGGITTKGLVKNMESSVDKHGNITYTFKLLSNLFNANASLSVQAGRNSSDLYLNIDRGMGSISMTGAVYPIGATKVFEGGYN